MMTIALDRDLGRRVDDTIVAAIIVRSDEK